MILQTTVRIWLERYGDINGPIYMGNFWKYSFLYQVPPYEVCKYSVLNSVHERIG